MIAAVTHLQSRSKISGESCRIVQPYPKCQSRVVQTSCFNNYPCCLRMKNRRNNAPYFRLRPAIPKLPVTLRGHRARQQRRPTTQCYIRTFEKPGERRLTSCSPSSALQWIWQMFGDFLICATRMEEVINSYIYMCVCLCVCINILCTCIYYVIESLFQ